ncbi:MAG: RsmD family RNA methyltransferase, partial [Acidimicrobiales bacterium]
TGVADRAQLLSGDAMVHLRQLARTDQRFDLALLDPPRTHDAWPDLLYAVAAVLAPGGVVVIESDRAVVTPPVFTVIREKRYGSTVVAIARASTGETAPSGEHE